MYSHQPTARTVNVSVYVLCVPGVRVGIAEIIFMILSYIYWRFTMCTFCGVVTSRVTSMCRVFSCVVERGCLLWPVHSLGKTLISLYPASFRTPRPNLPVTPGVSWLPTFAFQSPIMKRTSSLGFSSKRSCRSS